MWKDQRVIEIQRWSRIGCNVSVQEGSEVVGTHGRRVVVVAGLFEWLEGILFMQCVGEWKMAQESATGGENIGLWHNAGKFAV